MGGGASKSATAVAWTPEEVAENERAVELQRKASAYIVEHMYYGVPIKCGKKSIDPSSPIFIEVDPEILEEGMDQKLRDSVPSGVVVNGKGQITVDFVFTNISYTFNVAELDDTRGVDDNGNMIIPRPSPPYLANAKQNSLQIRWKLPQSPGIAKEIDLQYSLDLSVLNDDDNDGKVHINPTQQDIIANGLETAAAPTTGSKWHPLVVKTWDSFTFLFHLMDDLTPGTQYVTRIRFRNYRGWSNFSKPSAIFKTLPGPPATPDPPIIAVLLADSIQVRWNAPKDYGSPITEYILRGRSGGETEFTELYSGGTEREFLAMHLMAENVYSFELMARNACGDSAFSAMTTVTTPRMIRMKDEINARHMAGYNCRDAWRELWDPKTEQKFYFNQLTGTRQLDMPDVLKEPPTGTGNAKVKAVKDAATNFRMKRFRLVRSLHKQKAAVDSGAVTPMAQHGHGPGHGHGHHSAAHSPAPGGAHGRSTTPPPRATSPVRGGNHSIPAPRNATGGRATSPVPHHSHGHGHGHGRGPANGRNGSGGNSNGMQESASADASAFSMGSMLLPEAAVDYAAAQRKDIFSLDLHRETMLADCFLKFNQCNHMQELYKRVKVEFIGEPGIDSGGLTKEMFLILSKEILVYAGGKHRNWIRTLKSGQFYFKDPKDQHVDEEEEAEEEDVADMIEGDGDGGKEGDEGGGKESRAKAKAKKKVDVNAGLSTVASAVVMEKHRTSCQQYARFMGRFIGKALFDRQLIDMPLSSLLLRQMLGGDPPKDPVVEDSEEEGKGKGSDGDKKDKKPEAAAAAEKTAGKDDDLLALMQDLKELDEETFNSLKWMLENDITDILYESFTVSVNGKDIPLCKDGDKMDVTEENKREYIKLIVEWKTTYSITELLKPFLQGFHEIVPLSILKECELTTSELDLILNGKPTIDVDEIRGYCIFQGSKLPGVADGDESPTKKGKKVAFGEDSEVVSWLWQAIRSFDQENRRLYLKFVTGTSRVPLDGYDPPFNITEGVDMDKDSLPKAHTCFNQLVIPTYSSYDLLRQRLLFAITNTVGFELS